MDFRIELSHVDRGREASERVVVARHPSESADHVILRVLSYCMFHEEGLAFGPGIADAEGADLWTRDPRRPPHHLDRVRRRALREAEEDRPAQRRHRRPRRLLRGATPRRAAPRRARPRARAGKVAEAISVWTFDPRLVTALAEKEARSRKWSVTIVGDHVYVEADGATLDGEIQRGAAHGGGRGAPRRARGTDPRPSSAPTACAGGTSGSTTRWGPG